MSSPSKHAGGLKLDTSNGQDHALPPLAALFLVRFDMRQGYTIAWQRSAPDVTLDGVVDFKSLPSGLHNVNEDLVYFTHGKYAGISAFVKRPAAESERNARMLAVGALLPSRYGRLGRCWIYAETLLDLATQQATEASQCEDLKDLWDKHKVGTLELGHASPVEIMPSSMKDRGVSQQHDGYSRDRALSESGMLVSHEEFVPRHPILSMPDFTKLFGPLIFPLYRAALLRKRILMIGEAPVEFNCNLVYDLSIISSVPPSLRSLLPVDGTPPFRLRPLFNVGVHDIPDLSRSTASDKVLVQSDFSWIACTTDDVLGTKPELFDILVILPPPHTKYAIKKAYPMIVSSSPMLSKIFPKIGLKSTQRDARRYRTLRAGLRSYAGSKSILVENESYEEDSESLLSAASTTFSRTSVVEPTSWPLVAYSSLIWWASAGDRRSGLAEEEEAQNEQDSGLLLAEPIMTQEMLPDQPQTMSKEVAIVAFFHRLTSLIFTTISDAISREDGEDLSRDYEVEGNSGDQGTSPNGDEDSAVMDPDTGRDSQSSLSAAPQDGEPVTINREDMALMGLDIWSSGDRAFVEELVALWWGRKACVQGGRIECCGLRIL